MAHKKNNANLYIQIAAILIVVFILAVVVILKSQTATPEPDTNAVIDDTTTYTQ